MDYTTLTVKKPSNRTLNEENLPVTSLYKALQELPDPRRDQGKRYDLAVILCLLVLAKLAGQTKLSGATQWVRHRSVTLAQRFGLSRQEMPCQMTYCHILAVIDAQRLDQILSSFFQRWEAQSRCAEEPSRLLTPQGKADHRHLAIDGKALRSTNKSDAPVHQLSCYEVATGRVLWHCNVKEKHNEISELKPLLTVEIVKGRILSLDALHTQRDFCRQVQLLQGDYVLIAKDNQPTLKEDILDFFEDRTPDRRRWQEAETWDKAHGRLEYRKIVCSPDLNEWFPRFRDVTHIARNPYTAHRPRVACAWLARNVDRSGTWSCVLRGSATLLSTIHHVPRDSLCRPRSCIGARLRIGVNDLRKRSHERRRF